VTLYSKCTWALTSQNVCSLFQTKGDDLLQLPGVRPGALVRGPGGVSEGDPGDENIDKPVKEFVEHGDFRAGAEDGAHR
jgi:hypothetical protein